MEKSFSRNDHLKSLIELDSRLLLVIIRFAIPFGFGESTVAEVCREAKVDCDTFLAVANLVADRPFSNFNVALPDLIGYLKRAHAYFLDFSLPSIRKKLIEALNANSVNDVTFLIIKYFDDYVDEVRRHMGYEDQNLFIYAEGLLRGDIDESFSLDDYSANHSDMAGILDELKEIIIGHYRQLGSDMLNSFLYDIINCQAELSTHCRTENLLLVPAVAKAEQIVKSRLDDAPRRQAEAAANRVGDSDLSDREKDVIIQVAKGLSNKEIADKLNISVNTVTTHRRNIASKLQIHSQSGLTIYAIMKRLINLDDINLQ